MRCKDIQRFLIAVNFLVCILCATTVHVVCLQGINEIIPFLGRWWICLQNFLS